MKKSLVVAGAVLATLALLWVSGTNPGLGLRHRLLTWIKPHAAVTTIDVEGVGPIRLFLNPADTIITANLWVRQVWEPTETHWFVRSLRPGHVVVDVGANIGYYTILAGKLVGDAGRVYAFEPDPAAFALLERNVRLNGLDNVVVEQKAVSNQPGSIRLYLSDWNFGDHRIYQPKGETRASVEVEAVALDGYFLGVEDGVDFVKVDTQGAEGVILEGMMGLLRQSEEFVMALEFSPRHLAGFGSSPEELLQRLTSLGPRMFVPGPGAGPHALQRVTPGQLRGMSPEERLFVNLVLVRGRRDLLREIEASLSQP